MPAITPDARGKSDEDRTRDREDRARQRAEDQQESTSGNVAGSGWAGRSARISPASHSAPWVPWAAPCAPTTACQASAVSPATSRVASVRSVAQPVGGWRAGWHDRRRRPSRWRRHCEVRHRLWLCGEGCRQRDGQPAWATQTPTSRLPGHARNQEHRGRNLARGERLGAKAWPLIGAPASFDNSWEDFKARVLQDMIPLLENAFANLQAFVEWMTSNWENMMQAMTNGFNMVVEIINKFMEKLTIGLIDELLPRPALQQPGTARAETEAARPVRGSGTAGESGGCGEPRHEPPEHG